MIRYFHGICLALCLSSLAPAQLPVFMAARSPGNEDRPAIGDEGAAEFIAMPQPIPRNASSQLTPPVVVSDETVPRNQTRSSAVHSATLPTGLLATSRFRTDSGCGPSTSLLNRAAVCPRCGVDEAGLCCCEDGRWKNAMPLDFTEHGQGEYVGPARLHHVDRYRMRVDDQISLVYRLTRELDPREYKFNVGDEVRVEGENLSGDDVDRSVNLGDFDRNMVILPDGSITIPYVGQVQAAGRTVSQLRDEVQQRSKQWFNYPMWTITPIRVNTRLEDLRAMVDARAGQGGQSISLLISPDGTIQPPAIGSVCVQGLSLDEAKFEIDQRYLEAGFRGIEVSVILTQRAPTYVYVLGEVRQPGRFTLQQPTTLMGAISLAGGWNIGGNLRQIVVFRRAEDWRLVATRVNMQGALMGRHPTPADEIFLRDADVILVPKCPIQRIDDAINLVFTQGVNPLITFGSAAGFLRLSFAN